eukprot:1138134-Pelagomonas_calceolata.AAC.4
MHVPPILNAHSQILIRTVMCCPSCTQPEQTPSHQRAGSSAPTQSRRLHIKKRSREWPLPHFGLLAIYITLSQPLTPTQSRHLDIRGLEGEGGGPGLISGSVPLLVSGLQGVCEGGKPPKRRDFACDKVACARGMRASEKWMRKGASPQKLRKRQNWHARRTRTATFSKADDKIRKRPEPPLQTPGATPRPADSFVVVSEGAQPADALEDEAEYPG